MKKKNILIFLGGEWHKFNEFDKFINQILGDLYNIESTYDFNKLQELESKKIDVAIFYTCIDKEFNEIKENKYKITDAQITSLINWVKSGGSLLTFHSTTVLGNLDERLKKIIGGNFISHPEPYPVTIYPLFKKHSIINGISAFTVFDEFYIQDIQDDIEILMVSIDRSLAYPMVWIREDENGKIVNISMGHDEKVWSDNSYQRLILQSLSWLTEI